MYKIPAVIFAGGKSSRMGTDKSQLPFGGYPSLSQFQYQRLQKYFEEVYLSAKSKKFDFECTVIEDRYEESSPLAALITVFETLQADTVFVLSVDAPLIDQEVIAKLIEEMTDEADIVAAQSPNGLEPLCAIYKRSVLPKAKEMYQAGDHRMTNLLENLRTQNVYFEKKELFINLNHPHEYDEALLLL